MKTHTIDTPILFHSLKLDFDGLKGNQSVSSESQSYNLSWRKPTIKDIPLLKSFLDRYPSRSSDFTIGGILIWTDFFNYEYCIVDDTLFLRGVDKTGAFFHLPFGKLPMEKAISLIQEYCRNNGMEPRIINFDECQPMEIDAYADTHSQYLSGWREYLYDISQFYHFKGKKMAKKRNHLNYFLNHYGECEVEMMDGSQNEELIDFNNKFSVDHADADTGSRSGDYECFATSDVLRNYNSYPFLGIILRYRGKIIGYTFGEAIGDTFSVHAEKGDIEYQGIYQALSSFMSQKVSEVYPGVKYLNREDDMDNEALRKSKLSYHPSLFIAKHLVG